MKTFIIVIGSFQGHTLRLLSLPDFLDKSIGKILKVQNLFNSISAFDWKTNFMNEKDDMEREFSLLDIR